MKISIHFILILSSLKTTESPFDVNTNFKLFAQQTTLHSALLLGYTRSDFSTSVRRSPISRTWQSCQRKQLNGRERYLLPVKRRTWMQDARANTSRWKSWLGFCFICRLLRVIFFITREKWWWRLESLNISDSESFPFPSECSPFSQCLRRKRETQEIKVSLSWSEVSWDDRCRQKEGDTQSTFTQEVLYDNEGERKMMMKWLWMPFFLSC
jgi:hypothetical protein